MDKEQTAVNASAVVLAGGKSSRMGQAKALLPFGHEPLISHIVGVLNRHFDDIVIVAAPQDEFPPLPARVARDEIPYQGPVGGIYYGLQAVRGEVCFVTSCDAPFLDLRLVDRLVSMIGDYDVVVPHWEGRYQPLHAVYRKRVSPILQKQLAEGQVAAYLLYDKVRTLVIAAAEIRAIDPLGLSFLNLNTREDYWRALQLWSERREQL